MGKNVSVEEEKKIINLPLLDDEQDQNVFVSVNDRTYNIVRGEDVEVPLSVWEVLQNRERLKHAYIRQNRSQSEKVAQMMRM